MDVRVAPCTARTTRPTPSHTKDKFPQLISPPSDDICYGHAEPSRSAIKELAGQAELVIVVGSKNSSNSIRMVEVAKQAGVPAAYLVDFASEIDEAWLEGVTSVGLSSGASVPDILVQEVLEWLAERGYADVEIVKTADESLTFSLPKELRNKDLRAEAEKLAAAAPVKE
ncbi:4-hydroxy-3-methylbut-2-enyl diphosphate reductase [Streptomyces tanashiensis]